MRGARIQLVGLNRKWWDESIEAVSQNLEAFKEFDQNFYADIIQKTVDCAENGFVFQPTVKQFNYMRELARSVR